MPPKWPREPDRRDPAFRRLGDRINFAFNIAIFATLTTGIWFWLLLKALDWPWAKPLTLGWLGVIALQGLYVFVIADYSGAEAFGPDLDSGPNPDSDLETETDSASQE